MNNVNRCATAFAAMLAVSGAAGLASGPSAQNETLTVTKSLPASGAGIEVDLIPGFTEPWAIAFLPGGDALITERQRKTMRLLSASGELDPHPITGLPDTLQSPNKTRGGIDVAIHPDFADNRLVYFTYYKPMPENIHVATPVLARGIFNREKHRLDNVQDVFVANAWSVGGVATRIAFGRDGKVYMSIGSAIENESAPFNDSPVGYGSAHDAQDPENHGGKILRLNDDGSIPADNPFVGKKGYREEIYALGIRNALGLYADPRDGTLWATDNGPFGGDEINVIEPGANYGWPAVSYGRTYPYDPKGEWTGLALPPMVQPRSSAPGMKQPFVFWVPSPAVAGIMIYSGDKFPAWRGNILVAELKAERLERIVLNRQEWETDRQPILAELQLRLRDIKQGPDGFLYATSEDGYVVRIRPAEPDPS